MPGDMIIVPPGDYQEMLIMWKPVRLQGVGAASSIIDANAQPAGKMDPWRAEIGCLFGLTASGVPSTTSVSPNCPANFGPLVGFNAAVNNPQVDRLPLEGIVGWDTTTNGNLAQLLSEPTLMGAYEGAAITVVAKGVNPGPGDYFGVANEATFPTGSTNLTAANCLVKGANPYPSNFQCNPSSIDGLTMTDASEGGGGIFVHAWAHNLQIANNRVYANIGTLSGGINVGQGESPDAYLNGTTLDTDPGSCEGTGTSVDANDPVNTQEPYCFDLHVNVHNNAVTANTSIGDELFSGTPAGAGGVSFCTGADYYKFNYNWVCGNMSTGDGGGLAHIGFNKNGDIEHNTIIFNQSLNPTIPTNGGGIIVMATAPDGTLPGAAAGTECGSVTDVDCAPGLGDGTGPGLVINANLIMGNAAEAGSGGGLRFQGVNGTDIPRFPKTPADWYSVQVTNNVITNNVAGWDGGGVSLQDSLVVNLINNTIASNDSTATAGVLFNTLGAPLASAPGATYQTNGANSSAPQPAGIVTMVNSVNLTASLPGAKSADYGLTCPTNNPHCGLISTPYLANDLIWQNRTFFIGVGTSVQAAYQQNLVTLFNSVFTGGVPSSTGTALQTLTATGQCPTNSSYWDIGVRGDTGPGNHNGSGLGAGVTVLNPTYSVLTNASENTGTSHASTNITPAAVNFASQYCNGSRVPPELATLQGGNGGLWNVPPGISDATVPNPIFNLTPAATVDEGNNWINMTWGPLSLVNPATQATLGNYAPVAGSLAIDHIPTTAPTYAIAPAADFFGNPRPDTKGTNIDIGAVEYQGPTVPPPTLTSIAPNSGFQGSVVHVTLTGTNLTGASAINVSGTGVTVSGLTVASATSVTATFTIAGTANGSPRTVSITTPGGTSGTVTFTVRNPFVTSIAPNTGVRATTVPVTVTGGGLTGSTGFGGLGTITVLAGSFDVVNDTTITASLVIPANAVTGVRNISVTTPAGATGTVAFTVTGSTLTSIAPTTGVRGTTVPVTLTGTNLTGASAVTFSGGNVTCTGITSTSTTVKANCAIAVGAASGGRTVTVTTPIGTTNTEAFTVLGANLTISAPAPSLVTGTTTTHTGTITVSNAAGTNAGAFTFTAAPAVAKVGTAGGTFSIAAGGTCVSGHVVNPGASCTIVVQYAPSGTTTATGNVTVTGTGIGTATQTGANFTAN
jgi:hypothetical protein